MDNLKALEAALAAATARCAGKEPDHPAHDRRQELEEAIALSPATSIDGVAVKIRLASFILGDQDIAGRLIRKSLEDLKALGADA